MISGARPAPRSSRRHPGAPVRRTLRVPCPRTPPKGAAPLDDLDHRTGLPEPLRALVADHPRTSWANADSELVRFWLDKHGHLRAENAALVDLQRGALAAEDDPAGLAPTLAPRLQAFLAELDGHHRIEDAHYFPALRAARPELAAGFDLLDADHVRLHESLMALVEAARGFLGMVPAEAGADAARRRSALAGCLEATERLARRMNRHLEDEEDLIMPALLALEAR